MSYTKGDLVNMAVYALQKSGPGFGIGSWAGIILAFVLAGSTGSAAPASGEDPEDFKIELTGAAWLVDSSGTI